PARKRDPVVECVTFDDHHALARAGSAIAIVIPQGENVARVLLDDQNVAIRVRDHPPRLLQIVGPLPRDKTLWQARVVDASLLREHYARFWSCFRVACD